MSTPTPDVKRMTIPRDVMKNFLTLAKGVTEKRGPLPILCHVLIKSDGSKIDLIATDLEIGLRQTIHHATGAMSVCLPCSKLLELVKTGSGDVQISGPVDYKYQIDHATLPYMDADDYPAWPCLDLERIEVDVDAFMAGLSAVAYTGSCDDSRFNLNGILIDCAKGHMVATDGHRLALREFGEGDGPKFVVPKRAIPIVTKIKEPQSIGLDPKNLVIEYQDNITLTVWLIEGDYPDYWRVIPDTSQMTRVSCKKTTLTTALNAVSSMTSDRNRGITLYLNGGLGLLTDHPDLGSMHHHITAKIEPEPLQNHYMAINAIYLSECIRNQSNDVTMLARVWGEQDEPPEDEHDEEIRNEAIKNTIRQISGCPVIFPVPNGLDLIMPMRDGKEPAVYLTEVTIQDTDAPIKPKRTAKPKTAAAVTSGPATNFDISGIVERAKAFAAEIVKAERATGSRKIAHHAREQFERAMSESNPEQAIYHLAAAYTMARGR
jgi:DNA polymerase-3 subunit beta